MENAKPIRWTPKRKSRLLHNIAIGQITRDEAMKQHNISEDEMKEWERDEQLGTKGHRRLAHFHHLHQVRKSFRSVV